MDAGTGPHIDDVVCFQYGFLIMFNNKHGVAEIAQAFQCLEQAVVITLMQADRRFIKNIKHPGQPEPIWEARRIRCDSPPESVPEDRPSER